MQWCFALLLALCLLSHVHARVFTSDEMSWKVRAPLKPAPASLSLSGPGLPTNAMMTAGAGAGPMSGRDAEMIASRNLTDMSATLARFAPVSFAAAGEPYNPWTENPVRGGAWNAFVLNLPRAGLVGKLPWAGHYWPHYGDSINARWAGPGMASPSTKYAVASGLNPALVENVVSSIYGVDSVAGAPCTAHTQCAQGYACGARTGYAVGKCIPIWYGICQGWAMASMMEAEPRAAVDYGVVRFFPTDVKALLSMAYANMPNFAVGTKCRAPLYFDAFGRLPQSCRDLNPAVMHLILTNRIGLQHLPMAMDRESGTEVWTQPIVGYQVLGAAALSAYEANLLLNAGALGANYLFNPNAAALVRVQLDLVYQYEMLPTFEVPPVGSYLKHMYLDYVLELDSSGAAIGGEWLGSSRYQHPDLFFHAPLLGNHASVAGVTLAAARSLIRQ